jgi:hypothetical protein
VALVEQQLFTLPVFIGVNMKFVTHSLRSLANKLHILARQADIFGINQFTSR